MSAYSISSTFSFLWKLGGDFAAEPAQDIAIGHAVEGGSLTAKELVEKYCRDLYDTYGNYGEVARRTGLDWRTVKKNVMSGDQSI